MLRVYRRKLSASQATEFGSKPQFSSVTEVDLT
jgi:hypothetical protein